MNGIKGYWYYNVKLRRKYSSMFYQIFREKLDNYWNIYTGLDVLKFDEKILGWTYENGYNGDIESSAIDIIKKRYGDEGLKLVKLLTNRD